MFEELGISFGTGLILLIIAYFVIKSAVRNGITEAYEEIKEEKGKSESEEGSEE